MNGRPTFGSLFAGIGGIDLGLERAGWECTWQVECDPAANAVLAAHWPDVPRFDDVRTFRGESAGRVDLIAGGFPCQDISVAGNGAGLHGARSGLWWEMRRVIADVRPYWVLVENVPPLRTRGADEVCGALEALNYACWPLVVGARHVGALHRRDRVWIIAADTKRVQLREQPWGRGWQDGEGTPLVGFDGKARHLALGDAYSLRQLQSCRRVGEEWRWPSDASGWAVEPNMGRVAHGVPARVDRLSCLGNAVVPQVAEVIGRAMLTSWCSVCRDATERA